MAVDDPKILRLIKAWAKAKELAMRCFYGKVVISFEAGNVVNIKVEESFKVDA